MEHDQPFRPGRDKWFRTDKNGCCGKQLQTLCCSVTYCRIASPAQAELHQSGLQVESIDDDKSLVSSPGSHVRYVLNENVKVKERGFG